VASWTGLLAVAVTVTLGDSLQMLLCKCSSDFARVRMPALLSVQDDVREMRGEEPVPVMRANSETSVERIWET